MAKIEFHTAGSLDFSPVSQVVDYDVDEDVQSNDIMLRIFSPGDDGDLQLFEVKLAPDTDVEAHAHQQDEIMYVTSGELRFGNRVCPAGSVIVIPGMTLYGFVAGPEGGSFLNFRAQGDLTYISKDDFLAQRAASADG